MTMCPGRLLRRRAGNDGGRGEVGWERPEEARGGPALLLLQAVLGSQPPGGAGARGRLLRPRVLLVVRGRVLPPPPPPHPHLRRLPWLPRRSRSSSRRRRTRRGARGSRPPPPPAAAAAGRPALLDHLPYVHMHTDDVDVDDVDTTIHGTMGPENPRDNADTTIHGTMWTWKLKAT